MQLKKIFQTIFHMKNIANMITLLRIVFAFAMLFQTPFSGLFWLCYVCGGLTDLFDGFVARKLNQVSAMGAKLDSIADLFFAASILIIAVKITTFPVWLWVCIAIIALIRIMNYIIGYCKFKTFSSIHTYANKVAGFMIFAFPLLYCAFGMIIAGVFVCIVSFLSSLEELIITVSSKELDRDCKSFLLYKRQD